MFPLLSLVVDSSKTISLYNTKEHNKVAKVILDDFNKRYKPIYCNKHLIVNNQGNLICNKFYCFLNI